MPRIIWRGENQYEEAWEQELDDGTVELWHRHKPYGPKLVRSYPPRPAPTLEQVQHDIELLYGDGT